MFTYSQLLRYGTESGISTRNSDPHEGLVSTVRLGGLGRAPFIEHCVTIVCTTSMDVRCALSWIKRPRNKTRSTKA